MGRQVIIEEVVQSFIDQLASKNEVAVGLVLGQTTDQRDHVIHLVKTPLDETHVVQGNDPSDGKSNKKLKIPAIDDWNSDLIVHHAKQVTRMLLGGFYVLGLFVYTCSDLQASTISSIRQIMNRIYNGLKKSDQYAKQEGTERLLIHISSIPHRVMCKTVDMSSSLSSLKPTELKIKNVPTKWTSFSCQLALDICIPLSKDVAYQNLIEQIKVGLNQFCEDVKNAVATVDGSLLKTTGIIMDSIESGTKSKHGKQKEVLVPQLSYNVNLLMDTNFGEKECGNVEKECGIAMHVKGTIFGRTYVPVKSTFDEGIKFLKHDVLRTLISRCEVHCEDLLVIDEEQEGDRVVVHELPCRIFAPIPGLGITLSDYIFPGDTANDSLDAFRELLDINVEEKDIENTVERLPDSSDLTYPSEDGVPVAELLPPKPPRYCNSVCEYAS